MFVRRVSWSSKMYGKRSIQLSFLFSCVAGVHLVVQELTVTSYFSGGKH